MHGCEIKRRGEVRFEFWVLIKGVSVGCDWMELLAYRNVVAKVGRLSTRGELALM